MKKTVKKKNLNEKRFIRTKYFYIVIALIAVGLVGAIFQMSYSLGSGSAGSTDQYINTARKNGKSVPSSGTVKINKIIPDDYAFAVAYDSEKTSCRNVGGTDLGEDNRLAWNEVMKDGVNFSPSSGGSSNIGFETALSGDENPRDGEKDELTMVCDNIGSYQGSTVNLRLSIVNYEVADPEEASYPPFIGFYSPEYTNRIGVYAGNVNWVEVKYQFCRSIDEEDGKTICNSPINLKGHITYNDVDWFEGVHVLNNNKDVYARSNSQLNITNINNAAYIYEADNEDISGLHNPRGSFSETFEGSSINRVYTFASKSRAISDTNGAIWNTDVVSGASLEYAKDTASGSLGKAVKKGDVVKYSLTYTNDDLEKANKITIKSILSEGFEYVSGSASKVGDPKISKDSNGKSTLTWVVDLDKNSVDTFTYSAKVTDSDVGIVSNQVNIKSSNGSEYNTIETLKNSVPHKSYDSSTTSGKNGTSVKRSSNIKYNVKYANVYNNKKVITITETLSKYLEYVKGSGNLGEPVITKNSNGTTKLVWTRTLSKDQQETLTYSVKVASDTPDGTKVTSSTIINIEGEGKVTLDTLTNTVNAGAIKEESKEAEYVPKKSTPGYGSIAILIRDAYTGRPVKNTQFAIYNIDNNTIATNINGNYLETVTTGSNGVAEWHEVPFGKYIVKEVQTSEVFKNGFYEYNSSNTSLINSLEFTFDSSNDSLKWYKAGDMTGGISSGENFIERDSAKLGDINDDGVIDSQDLTLINAIYKGELAEVSGTELKKYMMAADVDNEGKCNNGNCKITENDIKLLESYINNPRGNQFEAFKVVYLEGSYQKRATVSLLGIPLDLKISNLEYDTSKELKGAEFVIKDQEGNVHGNISFTHEEEQIYLPVGSYVMTQEKARTGYDKYDDSISFAMDENGDVTLLVENYEYIKLEESKDGNKDHLIIYNKLGDNEVRVPYMDDSDRVIPRVAKVVGGSGLIIGSAAAATYRYGLSYKVLASRLTNFIK